METGRLGDKENMRSIGTKRSKREWPADLFEPTPAFTAFIKFSPSLPQSCAGIMSNPFGEAVPKVQFVMLNEEKHPFFESNTPVLAKGESAYGMTSVLRPHGLRTDFFRMTFSFFLDNLSKVRVVFNSAMVIPTFKSPRNIFVPFLQLNYEIIN